MIPLVESAQWAAERILPEPVSNEFAFPNHSEGSRTNKNSANTALNKWLKSQLCDTHSQRPNHRANEHQSRAIVSIHLHQNNASEPCFLTPFAKIYCHSSRGLRQPCIEHAPTRPRNLIRETKNQWTNLGGWTSDRMFCAFMHFRCFSTIITK